MMDVCHRMLKHMQCNRVLYRTESLAHGAIHCGWTANDIRHQLFRSWSEGCAVYSPYQRASALPIKGIILVTFIRKSSAVQHVSDLSVKETNWSMF